MSDLCLVASVVAKMHMAAEANGAVVPPPQGVHAANPKALQPVRVSTKASLIQPLPPVEFSAECHGTVQRVYANQGRDLPKPVKVALAQPLKARPEFSATPSRFGTDYQGPRTGAELYHQRLNALQRGVVYTRLPANSYAAAWRNVRDQPSYRQWTNLLAMEARAVGKGQGNNKLTVTVGDSLSLWMPSNTLPADHLWLNQGISGDNTTGILNRLSLLKTVRPDQIYLMAGINDLRQGATDTQILSNLRQIMQRLQANHPQSHIVVQSILPTAIGIPNERIRHLNQRIATIAGQLGVEYVDLYRHFADDQGEMRPELTTDGLHLTAMGYSVWQSVLRDLEGNLAAVSPPEAIPLSDFPWAA